MSGMIHQMARMQRRLHKAGRMLTGHDAARNDAAGNDPAYMNAAVDENVPAAEAVSAIAASRRQAQDYAPAIDYDRIAESASQRPVVVYVDKKAAATLLTRDMDTAIGNRNIQQLVSMGG